ncbi:ABC transporter permease [Rhodococcus sp. ACPA1]|uniref:ABC transporter permease n=1 Tax=Rhodococcus sp. ACPA1 TaxID=2028572 RepID=UPI0009EAB08C|nr:ABC transporter permease [Rhodococcus sp. ACPA1]PBC57076.1 ABC transporter permease [Rhodococcus sp. ACPA1]RZK59329.1 MAG: ABC transporter permease [Rhodococcus sp. (in: high G+C Gram-positive bacteria)]
MTSATLERTTLDISETLRKNSTLVYPFVSVFAIIAYFTITSPQFLTFDNATNIGRQAAVLLLVALAGTIVILIGSIDLSVGANVTLSGLVTAAAVDRIGLLGAITAGVLAGAAIGFANGAIYTGLKVPSFLVTLGTMSVCAGVAGHLSGGSAIVYSSTALPEFVNSKSLLGIPNVIFIVLAVAALLTAVSFRTKFGRYLYAIGGGEPVAVLSGINLRRYKILAFVLGGALCGLGGVILTGQVQAGSPSAGDALLLDSIAAVVMGGTALSGGLGGAHRTVLGVVVIALLSNGMDLTGVNNFTQEIVKGLVVVASVALTIDRSRYSFIK